MGKIPAAELERLKTEIDLVAMVEAKGVELKRHGKDLVGRCPFHNDKTPSLVVTPAKNLWHCLGACQVGGSVIDWVMKANGVEFREAVEILRSGDAKALLSPRIAAAESKAETPVKLDATDRALLVDVVEFYHQALTPTSEGMNYLKYREIADVDAIAKFKLGYCDRKLLGEKFTDRETRDRLIKIGVSRTTGRESFGGSIVIPIIVGGEVTEIYARRTQRQMTRDAIKHLYLPGPHRGVWNLDGVRESKGEVILTEALIDALSFWVNGFKNVTASYGTEGFTPDHLTAFKEHGVKRVLIAYDRDEAGDRAAEKLAASLAVEGIETWRVLFPKGMDVNSYVRKVKPAAQALRVCLESAEILSKAKRLAMPLVKRNPQEGGLPSLAAAAPRVAETANVVPITAVVAAKPVLTTTSLEIPAQQCGEDWFINLGDREYRVRGLARNLTTETLRVNLRVSFEARFYVDSLDLYQAKARTAFLYAAGREIALDVEMLNRDMGRVLLKCEELQASEIERRKDGQGASTTVVELTEDEEREAMALLTSPDLLDRVLAAFDACGVVGENTNKLVGYLATVSRKLEHPLAVVIQSSSAAGKSSLMDAVLAMVPDEDKVTCSAMTGQSLFYLGETSLKHKVLAIAEEEGARNAAYALKILQSERCVKIASTGKDVATGRLVTKQYQVEGPTTIMLTTTAIDVDEELMNRCLVLTVDEDREQTRAIHDQQRARRTLAGLTAGVERARILKLHQNAQRMLKPIKVVNNYATRLTFQDSHTRMRRDHPKYLELIDAIAFLHQHSREKKETVGPGGEVIEYIEVEPADIARANELCHEILGRSLDELAPQTRRLLVAVNSMVTEACSDGGKRSDARFTRKQVREYCGWSLFQVKKHMQRLVEHEYVIPRRGAKGQLFVYELAYDGGGADGMRALPGLVDAKTLGSNDHAAEHEAVSLEPLSHDLEPPWSPVGAALKPAPKSPEIGSSGSSLAKKAAAGAKTHIRGSGR